jgi:site-specific recombinase XerC
VLPPLLVGVVDRELRACEDDLDRDARPPADFDEELGSTRFRADQLTRTALETYLGEMEMSGYSLSSRARAKAVASGFARWLVEDKGLLRRNPGRGLVLPPQALLAPRQLSADQRYLLRSLAKMASATGPDAG